MTQSDINILIDYLSEAENIVAQNNKQINKESKQTALDIIALCILYGINIKDFKYSKLPEKAKKELRAKLGDLRNLVFNSILASSESTKTVSRSLNEALQLGENNMDFDTKEYIEREIADKTIHQRINDQVNRFSFEIEAYIAIGIAAKLNDSKILDNIWNNRKAPFASGMVSNAMDKGAFSAVRLAKQYHPRRGFSNSAIKQMERIGEMSILGTYHEYNKTFWNSIGPGVKYKTIITSSNPCSICIDSQYVIHDDNQLPFHPNCQCIIFPIWI